MPVNRLFDTTYRMLGGALDVASRRHRLISGNIANVDTVGYRPRDLDFNETLKRHMSPPQPKEMAVTDARHIDPSPAYGIGNGERYDASDAFHLDSVDIDEQMASLVENNMKYRTTAELMIRKMTILKTAITEGGR